MADFIYKIVSQNSLCYNLKNMKIDKKENKNKKIIWTEQKRMIIIISFLILSLIGNVLFFIKKHNFYKDFLIDKYQLLSPAVTLIDSKNLVVNFQLLRESLLSKYENVDNYKVSIYFEYLPTGANISVNKDEKIWPASLIKIPIAMAIFKKIENKKWSMNNELVILDEDKDSEFGSLYKKQSGTAMTIRQFLQESLINSDNTAHSVLLRNLESEEITDIYNHLGLDDIVDNAKKNSGEKAMDNRITAKRYSVFFRSLYNATYLLPENSQEFLNILKEAPRDLLGQAIPMEVPFVHKTGIRSNERVRADSGIVYVPGRPYLLTVMVQQKDGFSVSEEDTARLFSEISKEIYNYVVQL